MPTHYSSSRNLPTLAGAWLNTSSTTQLQSPRAGLWTTCCTRAGLPASTIKNVHECKHHAGGSNNSRVTLSLCTLMMNQRFRHTFGSFTLAFWRYPEYAPCIDRHRNRVRQTISVARKPRATVNERPADARTLPTRTGKCSAWTSTGAFFSVSSSSRSNGAPRTSCKAHQSKQSIYEDKG